MIGQCLFVGGIKTPSAVGNHPQDTTILIWSTSESQRENSASLFPRLRDQPSAGPWSTCAGGELCLKQI